jgi:hypothetical protein
MLFFDSRKKRGGVEKTLECPHLAGVIRKACVNIRRAVDHWAAAFEQAPSFLRRLISLRHISQMKHWVRCWQ